MEFLFGFVLGFAGAVALAVWAPWALLVPAGVLTKVVDFVKGFWK